MGEITRNGGPGEGEADARAQSRTSRTAIRVRYADTDRMGVVYNSNFLVWFEIGRTELLRERGLTYREIEERGFSLPVTEASMKIRRPARYDDLLTIETSVQDVRTRRVSFAYRIVRAGELLVEGTTVHVPVDQAAGRAAPAPEWMTALLW